MRFATNLEYHHERKFPEHCQLHHLLRGPFGLPDGRDVVLEDRAGRGRRFVEKLGGPGARKAPPHGRSSGECGGPREKQPQRL